MAGYGDPYAFNDYGAQRQRIQDDYAQRLAQNTYATFLSQQRGSRQLGDLARDFGRAYPRWSSAWGRRGMAGPGVRSGVYGRALGETASDYGRARQEVMQQMVDQWNMARLNEAQLTAERQRAFAELEFQKQQDIQNAALNLLNFKTYMGV